jgi:hypothetical protein
VLHAWVSARGTPSVKGTAEEQKKLEAHNAGSELETSTISRLAKALLRG